MSGRGAEEQEFFEAAQFYAAVMTTDARNTHQPERVQAMIDRARGRFYETYKAWMKELRKQGSISK